MKRNDSKSSIIRLVTSPAHNAWITTAANSTKAYKRPALRRNLLATAILLAFAPLAQAAPVGGQVVSGTGSISQSGSTTNIQQSSQNLSLDWQSFNIASQETVNFQQPSSSAIAVNRIFDTNGTQILGNLNANGQVFLINPNGILFGQGAQVNVGGLVASTLDLNDASLNSGSISFGGDGTGSVVNQGTINAASGGYVALLGNTVSNQGAISAQLGTVALGAGSAATLTFNGNSLVHMQVDQSTLDNLAENKALIQADGGQVIMTAGAKDALLASVVNNTGVIEARTVQNNNGTITLLGGMTAGTANVGGTLDASAPNGGDGGFVETSAAKVNVANDAQITTAAANGLTGSWLIDPTNIFVVPTLSADSSTLTGVTDGVDVYSKVGVSAGDSYLDVSLIDGASTNVTLQATNNITFNTSVNISTLDVGLTAQAGNNIAWGANTITTNGGAVTLSASDTTIPGHTGTGGVSGSGAITTSGGNINLSTTGTGGIGVGALDAGTGGTITLQTTALTTTTTTGSLIADGLQVISATSVSLTNTSNDVNTVAANIAGAGNNFTYTDANDVDIGSVTNGSTTTDGITTKGGVITVTSGAGGAGDLTLSQNADTTNATPAGANVNLTAAGGTSGDVILNAGNILGGTAGVVTLTSTNGAVNENSTGGVTANGLQVNAVGSSDLIGTGSNNVTTIAANISGAGNFFFYLDANAVDVGSVTNGSTTTDGITTNGGWIQVYSGWGGAGNLTLSQDVDTTGISTGAEVDLYALGATGDVILNAGNIKGGTNGGVYLQSNNGAVTEAGAGVITGDSLQVYAANSSSLNNATNDVATLAAAISGSAQSFTYKDASAVDIGSLGSNGIVTNGGVINVTSGAGGTGDLTLSYDADTTNGTPAGANVNLTAAGATSGDVILNPGKVNGGTGGVVTLTSTSGAVTEGGVGGVTANALQVIAAKSSNLAQTFNFVNTVAASISGAGQSFYYVDQDGVDIGTAGATSGISTNAGTITVFTQGAGGNLTLSQDADTTNGTPGGANVYLEAIGATGDVTLNAGNVNAGTGGLAYLQSSNGAVNELGAGGITANGLEVIAVGSSDLKGGANNVATITANITGAGNLFVYSDADAVDIGSTGIDGITTNGGDVGVQAQSGNLTLSKNVNTAGGVVELNSNSGAVTETTGAVIADMLLVMAANSSSLGNSNNDVNTLAANITNPAAAFSYADATSVDIGSVTTLWDPTQNGITTNGGDITVTALGTGNVTLSQNADTGGTTGTVTLDASAGGAVTESGGAVIANSLQVLAASSSALNTTANDVANLAANISGSTETFNYTDATSVDIGTAGATNGITTNGGLVTLSTVAGDITSSQNITTKAAVNSGAVSGAVSLTTTAGNINLSGDIITTGAANNAGTASAGGQVDLTAHEGAITLANVTTSGGASTSGTNNGGAAAAINATTTTGTATAHNITLNKTLTALGGTATGTGVAGASNTVTLTSTGNVNDNTAAGKVLAGKLLVKAVNSSSLTNTGNDVATLAAAITGAAQSFTYKDASAVDIGTVGVTDGITTNGGVINVTSGAGGTGDLTLSYDADTTNGSPAGANVNLTAVGATSGNVVLNTGNVKGGTGGVVTLTSTKGAVTEAGAGGVTANGLQVIAAGSSNLIGGTNSVATIAANITGAGNYFVYSNANGVDIGSVTNGVTTTDGITTNGGDAGVGAINDLTLSKNVNTGGVAGAVELNSDSGAVTETTGAVIADKLMVWAANSSSLNNAANNVNTLAANISNSTATFSYVDAASLAIGSVTTPWDTLSGIKTNNGAVTLSAGINLSLTGPYTIDAGSSTISLLFGQQGSGGTFDLTPSFSLIGTVIATGGAGHDIFNVDTGISGLTLDGAEGSDDYFINLGSGAQTITIDDNGTTGTDKGYFSSNMSISAAAYNVGPSDATGNSGSLQFIGGPSQFINFTGLEPIEVLEPITLASITAYAAGAITITDQLIPSGGIDPYTGLHENTYNVKLVGGELNFRNIGTLVVNGTAGVDTFNVNVPTLIDGANFISLSPLTTVTLKSGGGTDTFTVNSIFNSLTLNIFGTAALDTLQGAQLTNAILTGSGANGYAGTSGPSNHIHFTDIDALIGSGTGTLTGESAVTDSTWTLTGLTSQLSASQIYNDGSGNSLLPFNFGGFSTLQGGSTVDNFTLSSNTTSTIKGGDGVDVLNLGGFTLTGPFAGEAAGGSITGIGSATLTGLGTITGFNGTSANVTGNFTDIVSLIGTGTLISLNTASVWDISGINTNTYTTSAHTLSFGGFALLQAGSAADTLQGTQVVDATLTGSGANGYAGTLSGGLYDLNFTGINTLTGTGTSTLTGENVNSTWALNASNTYNDLAGLTPALIFSGFNTLNGGSATDTLQGTQITNVTLTAASDANGYKGTFGSTNFTGINTLTGTGSGTLTGENATSTWNIGGGNTYSDGGSGTLSFSGFGSLNGGSANDTFSFNNGSLTGQIIGGGGSDTVSGTLSAGLTITNTGDTTFGATTLAGNLTSTSDGSTTVSGAINAGSGKVNLSTTGDGDINLNSSITTTNNTTTAIILNAGSSYNAGDATGGNIVVGGSGSLSTGGGGRATLYTGTLAGTDLGTLTGLQSGSGHFRYNSDEAATNYTLALGSGSYAIYREQPTITITAPNVTDTYGVYGTRVGDTPITPTVSPLSNGDTSTQAFSTQPGVTVASPSLSASGHYDVGGYPLDAVGVDQLGYGVNLVNGSLTVDPKVLTVTANNVSKGYGSPDMLTYSYATLASGDTIGNVLGGSLDRAPGETLGNYAINTGTLAVISSNYTYNSFTAGTLTIVPLVEPWQPTTLFTQAGTTTSPMLQSQLAQIDSQQSQQLYKSKDTTSEITRQWSSGDGPAVTILEGGVRMPDEMTDENRKD